ncbi:substrate-binding domain-containing protein [Anaerocolumna sedimenticola]|uniref:Substrate-binding domain-containing protein n=1 Tax=Anaerocolumna sedimenticola TaxID=2696063 RepID=A0A6P1TN90_9FIRM|nr:LacI family DNA-binding transcriptional regulator [Anaerocolumna sedimenticola]QHQ61659.1 substrate-binding domain-containing protein [Anaerocolumna sedimenticola]
MAVTTKDLARICGVSRTTVTRALQGTGRISQKTKDRILQTAKEYDYQPDLVARSLVKGKTMMIGIIVVDLKNQYFPKMINAMENCAKKHKYLLNITLHEGDRQTEIELIKTLVGHRVDGLILSTVNQGKDFEKLLENLAIPVILIGHDQAENIPCVGTDEYAATKEATEFVISKGYKKIIFVLPPMISDQTVVPKGHQQRLNGFEDCIREHPQIEMGIICHENYVKKAEEFIRTSEKKIAFICSGDTFAINILIKLENAGLYAPTDYGVMGFDNINIFKSRHPHLTSVDNNIDEIGERIMELLVDMIENKSPKESQVIQHTIVQGETI